MKKTRPLPNWQRLPRIVRSATIIGLGGVGRQVAMQLTGLGVRRLHLVDARSVAAIVERRGRAMPSGVALPTVVPIHVATMAAGLLVAEFIRFCAGDRLWRSVQFDLYTLRFAAKERT